MRSGDGALDRARRAAAALHPDPRTRRATTRAVVDAAEAWVAGLADLRPVVPDSDDARTALIDGGITEDATPIEAVLDQFVRGVAGPGLNEPSPGFFGFIPGGGMHSSALGDYLAAAVNKYSGKEFAAPGAARLDRQLVEWMAGFLGYPAACGGDLTSGASVATLSAVVTARESTGVRAADIDRLVVFLSEHTHTATAKALRIAGLGECVTETVAVDGNRRMDPDALRAAIDRHRASGNRPWLLVGTAGSTDTGAVDPLGALADVAADHDLWFHVDAAYGGPFALTETGAARLRGIERSDSLVLDAHKSLFVPFGLGAVLVRDPDAMARAFAAGGNFMRDAVDSMTSAADLSPELTRPFRGLRLWLPLRLAGVGAFRAALDERLLLASRAHERLAAMDGVAVGPSPDLSIVTFRVAGGELDTANAATQAVLDSLAAEGEVLLSSTIIDGWVTLRMAILNPRIHVEQVDAALDVIEKHVADVGGV